MLLRIFLEGLPSMRIALVDNARAGVGDRRPTSAGA